MRNSPGGRRIFGQPMMHWARKRILTISSGCAHYYLQYSISEKIISLGYDRPSLYSRNWRSHHRQARYQDNAQPSSGPSFSRPSYGSFSQLWHATTFGPVAHWRSSRQITHPSERSIKTKIPSNHYRMFEWTPIELYCSGCICRSRLWTYRAKVSDHWYPNKTIPHWSLSSRFATTFVQAVESCDVNISYSSFDCSIVEIDQKDLKKFLDKVCEL